MNNIQYLSKIVSQPLALEKTRGQIILRALAAALLKGERPAEDLWGDSLPRMSITGETAIIPIVGILDIGIPSVLKEMGFWLTDANDVQEEINQALADQNVKTIVLAANSPGGTTLASEKIFSLVEAARKKKPVVGYIADGEMACSAAYWSLASASAIYAGAFADAIGNIGVWLAILDDSEYWASLGIKVEVFRSGDYKAIGMDSITADQRAYLQANVDADGELFRSSVSKYRPAIAAEDMHGQWFSGSAAATRGFVAAMAPDLESALTKFRRSFDSIGTLK